MVERKEKVMLLLVRRDERERERERKNRELCVRARGKLQKRNEGERDEKREEPGHVMSETRTRAEK